MKYVKPKSLTWWASFAPLVAGLYIAGLPVHGQAAMVQAVSAVFGNVPAAALINLGLVGIGLRGALK